MTATHEAVKTRHKETSLIFPVLALAVLLFWGSSQSLPVVVGINILAPVGILTSAFSVVRHADVLAHGRALRLFNSQPFRRYSRSQPDFRADGNRRCRPDPDARYALLHHYDCDGRPGRLLCYWADANLRPST